MNLSRVCKAAFLQLAFANFSSVRYPAFSPVTGAEKTRLVESDRIGGVFLLFSRELLSPPL